MQWLVDLLNWIIGHNSNFTGLLKDPRTQSEKDRDYAHEERVVTAPVNPFGNVQITQSPYFYENQNRTSSCVPHGVGLALAIERKADTGLYQRIAQMFPYRLRSNYPQEGCYLQNIFDIYRNFGAPLYTTIPTPMLESQANAIQLTDQEYTEASLFKGLTYYTVKTSFNDITTLAGIAADGHAVPILVYATQDEWGRDYPEIQIPNLSQFDTRAEVKHCISILPNSGFINSLNNKKYVTIQDSAWFGGKQIRHLSEDFIQARVFAAGYWTEVQITGGGQPPKHTFIQTLKFGDSGPEVKAMQQFLISQGFLPVGLDSGLFGGHTLAGVNAFQSAHAADVLLPNGLLKPTGLWGPATIKIANKISNL